MKKLSIREYRRRIEAVLEMQCPRLQRGKKGEETQKLPWKFLRSRELPTTVEIAYEVPVGKSFKDIEKQTDALGATCGAPIDLENRTGAVVIRILTEDFPVVVPFDPSMLTATKGRTLLLGYDRQRKPVTHDFRVLHALFAGQSRYGKTEEIKFLLLQLIDHFSSDEIEIKIIDMKQTSFRDFRHIPHITEIARDLASAAALLEDAHEMMVERGGEIWKAKGDLKYKTLLIVIDEAAQIAPAQQSTKEDRELAKRADRAAGALACVGAELGLGIWYCTQRPDANTINPQVKANMDTAICFKTKTRSNSEIVLDRPGAEDLPQGVPGRGIYSTNVDVVFQAPYVGSDAAWREVLAPYIREEAGEFDFDSEEADQTGDDETNDVTGVFGAADRFDFTGRTILDWSRFPREASVRVLKWFGAREVDRRREAVSAPPETVPADKEGARSRRHK